MIGRALAALAASWVLALPAARADETCPDARAAAEDDELPRAFALLERCAERGRLDRGAQRLRSRVRRALRGGAYAPVFLEITPPSARVTVSALGDLVLPASAELWLAPGTYELRAEAPGHHAGQRRIAVTDLDRVLVRLALAPIAESAPAARDLDFADEPGAAVGTAETVPDLRPKQHASLLPDRYQRAPDPTPTASEPRSRRTGWLAVGGGAAALVAGAALHAATDADRSALALGAAGTIALGAGLYLVW